MVCCRKLSNKTIFCEYICSDKLAYLQVHRNCLIFLWHNCAPETIIIIIIFRVLCLTNVAVLLSKSDFPMPIHHYSSKARCSMEITGFEPGIAGIRSSRLIICAISPPYACPLSSTPSLYQTTDHLNTRNI